MAGKRTLKDDGLGDIPPMSTAQKVIIGIALVIFVAMVVYIVFH